MREELERHLAPLVDLKQLSLWSDKEIAPGERWDNAIKRELQNADLFLMLANNAEAIRQEKEKVEAQRLKVKREAN